jgi:hypothetical protein
MMKQVLLGIPGVPTEILLAKRGKLGWADFRFLREIFLSQNARNPNIDRHHFQPAESEQQDTVCNLIANAREAAENWADFI